MTVTRVLAGAFNPDVCTCTYSCYYFSRIVDICRFSLRWRQKLRCSKPHDCCATRKVRREEQGTHSANSSQPAALIVADDSHWWIWMRHATGRILGNTAKSQAVDWLSLRMLLAAAFSMLRAFARQNVQPLVTRLKLIKAIFIYQKNDG